MAGVQTINNNSVEPLGGPNTGLSTELGDSWNTFVTKANAMFSEIYGGVQNGGGVAIRQAGNIFVSATTIGSSATNTTQTMLSTTIAANSLKNVGNGFFVEAWGRTAANTSPTTINLNIGGTFVSIASAAHNASHWYLTGQVYKTAANTQQELYYSSIGAVTAVKSTSDTNTDASSITVSVTAADVSALQSDILLDGMSIEWFN
jgi:hypothetical protein